MPSSSEPRRREDRALRLVLLVVLLLMPLARRAQASTDDAAKSAAPTHRLHLELDPQPFALGGHGVQVGWRPARLPGLRIALANFALDIPDAIAQLDDNNDGFHLRVRPTPALFVHTIYRGFLLGASLRYLRLEYTHDDVAGGVATTEDISLEAICGYRWFPTHTGFYLHPWLGLSTSLHQFGKPQVGDRTYEALPIQPFFTINLGWELSL